MDRSDYDRYLKDFNARDYDAVLSRFADQPTVSFAGYAFRSKPAIRDFYAFFHEHVDERISVTSFAAADRMIALEANVRLEGLRDLTPEVLAEQRLEGLFTLGKGQVLSVPQFIHYHLDEDGRFRNALCAVYQPPLHQR